MKEILQRICDKHGFKYANYTEDLFSNFRVSVTRLDRQNYKITIDMVEPLTMTEKILENKILRGFNLRENYI